MTTEQRHFTRIPFNASTTLVNSKTGEKQTAEGANAAAQRGVREEHGERGSTPDEERVGPRLAVGQGPSLSSHNDNNNENYSTTHNMSLQNLIKNYDSSHLVLPLGRPLPWLGS